MVNLEPKQHFETPKPNARYFRDKNWIPIVKNFVSLKVIFKSSRPELFLVKGVLKKCNKFTREHPCRSVNSIKQLC